MSVNINDGNHIKKIHYFRRDNVSIFIEYTLSFLGVFLGIGIMGLLNSKYFVLNDNFFLLGSFGASSVILHGINNSPLGNPRNLIGGHLLCAFIGVTINKLIPNETWLAAAVTVGLSTVLMQITKTMHPPGAATGLTAVIGSEKIKALGYMYIISPVLLGVLILFVIALILNNLMPYKTYPIDKNYRKRLLDIINSKKE